MVCSRREWWVEDYVSVPETLCGDCPHLDVEIRCNIDLRYEGLGDGVESVMWILPYRGVRLLSLAL